MSVQVQHDLMPGITDDWFHRAHEAEQQKSISHRAWNWMSNTVNMLPQKLLWAFGAGDQWPQAHEEQHSLLMPQDAQCMSDKHSFELPMPLEVPGNSESLDGGTSGAASVVVSRSSRGQGRGQMSSCATSLEGLAGASGAVTNPLARASLASHATQHSFLAGDGVEPVQNLTDLEQQVEGALQVGKMNSQRT